MERSIGGVEFAVEDTLSVAGALAGLYLVVAGVATLLGMPWQYGSSAAVSAGQILGALATVGVGAGLAWLTTR
jgi:hypothetical protein